MHCFNQPSGAFVRPADNRLVRVRGSQGDGPAFAILGLVLASVTEDEAYRLIPKQGV